MIETRLLSFLKEIRMSTLISITSYKMLLSAQTWVLKNEVLEKSNTRFSPTKRDEKCCQKQKRVFEKLFLSKTRPKKKQDFQKQDVKNQKRALEC